MTPYSSIREKYNTGYLGWLKAYAINWFTTPYREWDSIVEWAISSISIICYIVVTVIFPITYPITIAYIMITEKRRWKKRYSPENLKPSDKRGEK